ncbi:hypothetical protein, partial [Xanthomonas campestris]
RPPSSVININRRPLVLAGTELRGVDRSIIAAVVFHLIVEWQASSGMARFLKRLPIRQLALLARGVIGGGSVRFFLKNTLLPS